MNPTTIALLKSQELQCREAGLHLTAQALAHLIRQLEALQVEEDGE